MTQQARPLTLQPRKLDFPIRHSPRVVKASIELYRASAISSVTSATVIRQLSIWARYPSQLHAEASTFNSLITGSCRFGMGRGTEWSIAHDGTEAAPSNTSGLTKYFTVRLDERFGLQSSSYLLNCTFCCLVMLPFSFIFANEPSTTVIAAVNQRSTSY